ncbi:hypothetical protein Trco_006705 [Trichoderma cornu-damae]|uniref:Uncharacterized protein n=1 Tax=Trichoderma cornu-damae TaxID=654480 RepID=A0A9P8QL26_9HYPO|nr:hypothetical protein Trco_006705 [Trichoderma cornu-damae]
MGTTSIPIVESFPIDTDDSGDDEEVINKHYNIQLSSPSLKFSADKENGTATLTFDINGTYYTVIDEGTPKKTHTIPQGAYGLEIDVPISSVTGDEDEHQSPDTVIEFKDDTIAQHYIVFHFQNKQTTWQMQKKSQDKLDTDDEMRQVCSDVALWLGDANNIQWIDFRMAQVSNAKGTSSGATDTDYLRPRSFVLSTSSGTLMVFVRTKSSKDGRVPARFNYKGSDEMLPIPAGSDASIIISQNAFARFVSGQIQNHCQGNLRDSNSVSAKDGVDSGIQWDLVLRGDTTWNIGNDIGLFKYTIDTVDVDFSKHPLSFKLLDDDKLSPTTQWSFDFSATAKWYLDDDSGGVADYGVGLTQISASITKASLLIIAISYQGKPFDISGDTILLELDFETVSPSIELKALHTPSERSYTSRKSIPPPFHNIAITLPSFKAKLDGLSFFAAQNVLVPGVEFIKSSEAMAPHDVVILGTMPRSKGKSNLASPLTSLAAIPKSASAGSAPSGGGGLADLLDELYSNDAFLGDFLNRGISGELKDVYALLAEKSYNLDTSHVVDEVQGLTTPGPDFDLRFAGGVYEVGGGDAKYRILVHPVHRTIFVDDHAANSQRKHEDGRITFESRNDNDETSFDITFEWQDDGSGNKTNNLYSIQGKAWSKSQTEADAIPIKGQRLFPWDDENASLDAMTRADTEGLKSLAMSLDLVNFAAEDDDQNSQPPRLGTSKPATATTNAEPATTIAIVAGVLGIVVALCGIDSATGEGWKRWKKRASRLKKLVVSMGEKGFIKALRGSTSEAKLKQAAENMEQVVDRIINQNLGKATDPDVDIDTVLEETRSDVDGQVAEFIYSGFEIAARKGFKALFAMDQDATAEALKKTIKDGLSQWVNEDAYGEYLRTKVQRILAERDRVALLTKSGGLDRRISAAETQIEQLKQQREELEAAKDEEVEKVMKEQGVSEEDAKQKVEESIKELADEIEEKQEEKARNEADKKRADDGVDAFTKEIDDKKRQEEAQKGEIWKTGGI